MKKLFRPLVLGGVLLLAAGLVPVMPATPARAATVTDANLKQMLEDLLREHPEIILDVLRSHSEDVLDIAQAGANARRKAALEAQWHKEVKNTPQKQISLAGRPVKGNAAAPVRIVAFSDFTCHYCQQATRVLDEVMKKYGKNVSLVYKHMPLDEQGPGMLAARYFVAVAAQSESKAWKFYDAMYADRDRLLLEGQKFVDEVCDRLGLILFVDGARLGSALTSPECDMTLKDLAALADCFYIGGTKNGLLFGEAMVIVNPALQKDFRYMIKHNGGMIAKGRLGGVMFLAALEHDDYFAWAKHANEMADLIRAGMERAGIPFFQRTTTNQIFAVLTEEQNAALELDFAYERWAKLEDGRVAVRFVTSWATEAADCEKLASALEALA